MAFREVRVFEVREVLRLWLRGEGLRAISRRAGMDRKTVRRYVEAGEELGLDGAGDEVQLTDLLVSQVVERVRPHRIDGRGEARRLLDAHRDQLEKWLDRDRVGLTVVKVHELLERQGVVVPERTLHRYAREELDVGRSVRGSTVRVADGEPGDELQVDFGRLGRLADPETGRQRDLWALVFTPVLSRFSFVWLTHRQTLGDVIAGFEAAWAFFGGVFATVIPDNMKTVVDGADSLEPRFNQAFVEYAQARGFVIDPARVRSPQDKPRVERVVPYVRSNFFAGEVFIDLADAERRAELWCRDRAGMRIHGTTQLRPAEHFDSKGARPGGGADRPLRRADLRHSQGPSGSPHRGGPLALLDPRGPDRHEGRRARRPVPGPGVLPGSAGQGPPPPAAGWPLHGPGGSAGGADDLRHARPRQAATPGRRPRPRDRRLRRRAVGHPVALDEDAPGLRPVGARQEVGGRAGQRRLRPSSGRRSDQRRAHRPHARTRHRDHRRPGPADIGHGPDTPVRSGRQPLRARATDEEVAG
jgi:transposase